MMQRRNTSRFSRDRGNFSRNPGRRFSAVQRQPRKRKYIDPSLFIRKAEEERQEEYTSIHTFADFPIDEQIKRNIQAHGYTSPTPIQDQSIPHILNGRDIVGTANTGTGKTAAFLIPLIDKVHRDRLQKVLIIAPTRELAVQIEEEFREFSKNMNLYSALCIGGVGIHNQIAQLRRNPQFVIGSPGRLKDLEQQRQLAFTSFATIVLDEVDRMLDMGFINDVKYIVSRLSKNRHSLFFSATLPQAVQGVMQGLLRNPVMVSVKSQQTPLYVEQNVVRIQGRPKVDILHNLLIQEGFDKVLVFGRTKRGAERLSREMNDRGFKVAAIHSNKNQFQRQRAIEQFKDNKIQILVATDIASRGLDIEDITHVINYDAPESFEDYIHRIGRTGRAGKKGNALTFVE